MMLMKGRFPQRGFGIPSPAVCLPRLGAAAPAFTAADLYGGGEDGDYWTFAAADTDATNDGDVVGSVTGQLGTYNLAQSTASLKPLYKTGGGLHWLKPDGVDDRLALPAGFDVSSTGKWTLFWALDNDGDTDWIGFHEDTGASPWVMIAESGSVSTTLSPSGATFDKLYVDGAVETPSTRGDVFTLLNGNKTMMWEFSMTGVFNTPHAFFGYTSAPYESSGKFYALGLINRALTAQEVSDLDGWLKTQQGR